MVRKTNKTRNPVKKYKVYQKGFFVGTISATPERVRELERKGFVLKSANPVRKRSRDTERIKTTRLSRSPNPKGLTLIYAKVTRIEGTKGTKSAFPGQRFFHNFKRPYPSMWGTTDRRTLIIK
jgi:hypothetical protein